MLEAINLFPETRYLRVRKNYELDHKCGGCASLLIMTTLFVLLVVKLFEAFSYRTIFFTSENVVDVEPPMTTISTYQNDTIHSPYMITASFRDAGCVSQKTVKAYHFTVTGLVSSSDPIT